MTPPTANAPRWIARLGALDQPPIIGWWWVDDDGAILLTDEPPAPPPADPLADLPPETPQLLGVAPASEVVAHHANLPDLTPRQAEAAARLLGVERSLSDPATLHVAVGAAEADGGRDIAVVSRVLMQHWLGGAAAAGVRFSAIVPSWALVPRGTIEGPVAAAPLGDALYRTADGALPAEPALLDALALKPAVEADSVDVDAALIAALTAPPLDLLSGDYAQRPRRSWDAAWIARAVRVAALILLLSIGIAIAQIVQYRRDTARLDAEAEAAAARVLRPAPALEVAVAQLDARLAALGRGSGRFSAPTSALVAALDRAPGVSVTTLGWRSDGTLSVNLAAPRVEEINAVLIALQGDGWAVTATPRTAPDGRATGDITIRGRR